MDSINQIARRDYRSRPKAYSEPLNNERLIAQLWLRLDKLFPHLWISREGDIADESGTYTKNFLFWCRKLAHLKEGQVAKAVELLESRCVSAAADGTTIYPPSYANLIGLARTKASHRKYTAVELPYSLAERNRKGKEQTANIFDLMKGVTTMSEEEANEIIEGAKQQGLRELFDDRN